MHIPTCKFCHLLTLILFQIIVFFIAQKKIGFFYSKEESHKGLEQHKKKLGGGGGGGGGGELFIFSVNNQFVVLKTCLLDYYLIFVYPHFLLLFFCISAAFPQVVGATDAPAFYLSSWNQTSSAPILFVTRMFIFTHSQLKILHSHSAVFSELQSLEITLALMHWENRPWSTKIWEHLYFACFGNLTHFNVIGKLKELNFRIS